MEKFVLVVPSIDDEFYKINKMYLKLLDDLKLKYVLCSYNESILENIDNFGLVILTGGGDFSQEYLKEKLHPLSNSIYKERDEFEINLVKTCYKKRIPTLGICRGAQVINLALGGSLKQHIDGHIQAQPKNITSHFAYLQENCKLKKILKKDRINVNSFHHQVIKNIGDNLICSALSEDGEIEAIEGVDDFLFMGLQWHPEHLKNEDTYNIFNYFKQNL